MKSTLKLKKKNIIVFAELNSYRENGKTSILPTQTATSYW